MTYIIHGATGAQGGPIVELLAGTGQDVVAPVRDAATYHGPAHPVEIDYSSPAALVALYRDADGIFVHVPIGPAEVQQRFVDVVLSAVHEAKPARVVVSTSGASVTRDDGTTTPVGSLIDGLNQEPAVTTAVVETHIYLENLLLPFVSGSARQDGVLRYPLREDYPVAWVSHLDVAAVVSQLLTARSDVSGLIGVGALPGLTGADLAAAFSAHWTQDVRYEALTPDEFEGLIEPLVGPAAPGIADFYRERLTRTDDTISEAHSAQSVLGLTPRSLIDWLRGLDG